MASRDHLGHRDHAEFKAHKAFRLSAHKVFREHSVSKGHRVNKANRLLVHKGHRETLAFRVRRVYHPQDHRGLLALKDPQALGLRVLLDLKVLRVHRAIASSAFKVLKGIRDPLARKAHKA